MWPTNEQDCTYAILSFSGRFFAHSCFVYFAERLALGEWKRWELREDTEALSVTDWLGLRQAGCWWGEQTRYFTRNCCIKYAGLDEDSIEAQLQLHSSEFASHPKEFYCVPLFAYFKKVRLLLIATNRASSRESALLPGASDSRRLPLWHRYIASICALPLGSSFINLTADFASANLV